jgi:hypothetical protein
MRTLSKGLMAPKTAKPPIGQRISHLVESHHHHQLQTLAPPSHLYITWQSVLLARIRQRTSRILHAHHIRGRSLYLIDVYRLRVQGDFEYGDHIHGIHKQDSAGSLPDLQDFMTRAQRNGLLPNWWDERKRQSCGEVATTDTYSSIRATFGKQDVQDRYGKSFMPKVFQTSADRLYGKDFMV